MIISHKHKFIFIKTRKTAGTSLDIALSEYCGPDDVISKLPPEDEKIRQELGFRGPQNYQHPLWKYSSRDFLNCIRGKIPRVRQHMHAEDVIQLLGEDIWNEYYTFTVEREPYGKAISRYYWSTSGRENKPSIEDYLKTASVKALSNWKFYTIKDKLVVDKVISYENLKEEIEELQLRLGIGKLTMPRAKGNYRKDRRHYSKVLCPESRQQIELICAKEIAFFDYKWTEEC